MSGNKQTSESETGPILSAEGGGADLPAVAAGLVHEVKNPLAAIHLHLQLLEGYVDEVEGDDLKNKILKKVNVIKNEVLSLNQSLQDFIRLIRAEKRALPREFSFNDLVDEIVSFLEPQALREGIDIQFQAAPIENNLRLDPTFLKQIIMNLIINAIQAFEKSERPMMERRIIVSTGTQDDVAFVRVADNGPGMPEDTKSRIFDPFFTTKESGSGLGLALVKKMIASMGGHLDLLSEEGKGTTFTVYLGTPPGTTGLPLKADSQADEET